MNDKNTLPSHEHCKEHAQQINLHKYKRWMRSSKMGFIWFAAFDAHLNSLYTTFIPVFYVTFGIFHFHGTYLYHSLCSLSFFLFTHKFISISSNQIIKLSSTNFLLCTVFLWTFGLTFFFTSARRSVVLRGYWNILKLI